jgi:hypothetical protein
MAVVGASAFGGAAMLRGANAPFGAPSTGTIIVPGGGTAVQPPPGNGTTGQGGGATSMPEPGSAAILAVAMIVVLVSSWIQGGRAFRGTAESTISRLPTRDPAKTSIILKNSHKQHG